MQETVTKGIGIHTLLLLDRKLVLVVAKVIPSEEKGEFQIILLLLHGHLFELGPIAGHELCQLVDDIAKLLVWEDKK